MISGPNYDVFGVDLSFDDGVTWSTIASGLPYSIPSYTISTLALGTSFRARVSASNGVLTSYSSLSQVITVASKLSLPFHIQLIYHPHLIR